MRKRIIATLAVSVVLSTVAAAVAAEEDGAQQEPSEQQAQGGILRDNAPSRHVVVRGDTLWGIASKFLKDPWKWPNIWGMNREEMSNPHLIYPGDIIVLDLSGKEPRLRLDSGAPTAAAVDNGTSTPGGIPVTKLSPRARQSTLASSAIPTIPASVIDPFLTRPMVISEEALEKAPKIIATQESRVVLGGGDVGYAQDLQPASGTAYQVYRPARPLIDPETKENLGYEAFYLGDARVKDFGPVSTLLITKSVQEITTGDKLVVASAFPALSYVPHVPQTKIDGRVIASTESSVTEIGPLSVVVINRGAREGLSMGHVLALYRAGETVATGRKTTATLPDERYGVVLLFRVFDKVSYGLVMNTTRSVNLMDFVRTP
jgi:hypothetical protein